MTEFNLKALIGAPQMRGTVTAMRRQWGKKTNENCLKPGLVEMTRLLKK